MGGLIVERLAAIGRDELGCETTAVSAVVAGEGRALYASLGFEEAGRQAYILGRPERAA